MRVGADGPPAKRCSTGAKGSRNKVICRQISVYHLITRRDKRRIGYMVMDKAQIEYERQAEKELARHKIRCPWCKRFARMESSEQYTDIICNKCGIARFS